MRSIKGVLVALVAVLAFGAVAASGASAHQWKVNGVEASGQEVSVSGEVQFESPRVTITCKSVAGKGTVGSGAVGSAELKFTGCTTSKFGCGVSSPGQSAGTIVTVDIATKLVERETQGLERVLAESFTGIGIKEELMKLHFINETSEGCAFLQEETIVKGSFAAEVKALSGGQVELRFPNPNLKGNVLEIGGYRSLIFGVFDYALVGGGTLTAS